MTQKPKVIIVGSGFGGLNAAKSLKRADIDLLVIDRTNHHLFQPLLYQVATAALSSETIATSIRGVLGRQENTSIIMANVNAVDLEKKCVLLSDGEIVPYNYLILAPGASHAYFGHDEWEKFAPGLKTVVDAIEIRERILLAFERAERCEHHEDAEKYLRFVIVGAGPTGVEMAGAIAEISGKTLFKNFKKIKPEDAHIYLIEGTGQILPTYPAKLGKIAKRDLEKLGVTVMLNTFVTNITENEVIMGDKKIETSNVIWAAGNQAAPVLKTLGVQVDKQGRVVVGRDLSIPGHPEVFVIGDAANAKDKKGNTLPGVAPVAIQQGRYVANVIRRKLPPEKRKPFVYFDKGNMATIGRAKAVVSVRRLNFSGFLAWLTWCFIHIWYLISFRNRIFVMTQWLFWYVTGKRHVRLIGRPVDGEKATQTRPDSPKD